MFVKVIGKECGTPDCERFGQMKESSAYLCEQCSRELKPITTRNASAVAAALLGGLLMMSAGGLAIRGYLTKPPSVEVAASGGQDRASTIAVSGFEYAFQSAEDGRPRIVSPHQVFRSGDRFRLVVKSPVASNYYVFYEDRPNDKIEVLYPQGNGRNTTANDTLAIPSGNGNWLTLDESPGQERFILIASTTPIEELDFGTLKTSRSRFDSAIEKVRRKYGLANVTTVNESNWIRVQSQGKGLLLARCSLQHQ